MRSTARSPGAGALAEARGGALWGFGIGGVAGALFHKVCFVAGTQVVVGMDADAEAAGGAAAAQGGAGLAAAARVRYVTRSIEALRPGQWLLARDQHDPGGPVRACRIGRTYVRTAHHLRVVTIRDDEGREQTVRVTDEHPFHIAWRGWTKARELSEGDRLLGPGGEASAVTSNLGEAHPEGVTVYNLEVEDDHTYFVRAEGSDAEPVWVHNECLPAKGTPEGDAARYERYRNGGGILEYDEWYSRSRGGRSGSPAHQAVQAKLKADGFETEVRFGDRYADAAGPDEIHQIGELNQRGDPVARERDAIFDILSSREYAGQDIYFWDVSNPSALPIRNPHLLPTWGNRP